MVVWQASVSRLLITRLDHIAGVFVCTKRL